MSSRRSTRASSSTPNSSNMLRLPKMQPIATTAKKLTSKIKSIRILRIFRTRAPNDLPDVEREVRSVAKFHRKTGTGNTESDPNRAQDEQPWRMRILSNDVHAMPRDQWKFSTEKVDKGEVDNIPVSDCEQVDVEVHIADVDGDDVSDTGPPSYVTIITGLARVSQDRQFSTHDDLTFDEMNPAEWTQDIDEGMSCETFYTAISAAKWMTHEPESFHFEIDEIRTDVPLATPGSDQSQQQSSVISTGDSLARVLFPDLGALKEKSLPFDKSATGDVDEIRRETVESSKEAYPSQSLKNIEILAFNVTENVSKNKPDDIDIEKAERTERRRKLLAKKKEARLKRALEYNQREAARVANSPPKGSELNSNTEPPAVDNRAQTGTSSSEESKTEDEFAYIPEDTYDPAGWSKDEARKAKERRKLGQKERLLNLLSGCNSAYGDRF